MTPPRRRRAQTPRQYPRTARINELVREIAAEELERIDDERLELVAITAVDVDSDLRQAVVWFDSLRGEAEDEAVLEAFGDARWLCKRRSAARPGSSELPRCRSKPDPAIRTAERVEQIIREQHRDDG